MPIDFGSLPIAPAELLGRMEDRLKSGTGLPADSVFLSLAPDDLHLRFPPADLFITLTPLRFPVWHGVVSGAGQSFQDAAVGTVPGRNASNLGFDALVTVTAFARLNSDQELRSSELIKSASAGLVRTAMAAVAALQFWTAPADDDPNSSYLREYMKLADGPSFLPREYNKTFWALCKSVFEFRFTAGA